MKKSRSISPRPPTVHLQTRQRTPLPSPIRDDFYAYSSSPRFHSIINLSSNPKKPLQPHIPATFSTLFSRTSENGFDPKRHFETKRNPARQEKKGETPKFKGKKRFEWGRESLGELLKGAAGKKSPTKNSKNNNDFRIFGKKVANLDQDGRAKKGCKNFSSIMRFGNESGKEIFVTEYSSRFIKPTKKDYFNDYSPFNC